MRRENLFSVVCEQQRRRPACASAQSDQHLCYWLFGKYHIKNCYERNFNFLASLCRWGEQFESHFVGNPEDRFSRDEINIPKTLVDRKIIFLKILFENICCGTHWKHLFEMIPMSTHYRYFFEHARAAPSNGLQVGPEWEPLSGH